MLPFPSLIDFLRAFALAFLAGAATCMAIVTLAMGTLSSLRRNMPGSLFCDHVDLVAAGHRCRVGTARGAQAPFVAAARHRLEPATGEWAQRADRTDGQGGRRRWRQPGIRAELSRSGWQGDGRSTAMSDGTVTQKCILHGC
jgi:hypothetical protein